MKVMMGVSHRYKDQWRADGLVFDPVAWAVVAAQLQEKVSGSALSTSARRLNCGSAVSILLRDAIRLTIARKSRGRSPSR